MRNILAISFIVASISIFGYPVRSTIGGKYISFSGAEGNATYTAADYVQDGLVALWDGIENAGRGVSDSGLRCEELTGNNGSVLFNGDVIRIDNGFDINSHGLTSGYGYGIGNPLRSGDVSGVSTIQICFEYPAKYNNWQGVFRYNVSDIGVNGSFKYLYHKNGNARSAAKCGDTFNTGEKTTVTMIFTVREATPTVYIGGTQLSNVGSNGNYTGAAYDKVLIGAGYDSPWKPCKMIFHSARVYNRALTAAEIAANYEIDKARFGL